MWQGPWTPPTNYMPVASPLQVGMVTDIFGHCQHVIACDSRDNLTHVCLAKGTRHIHKGVKIIYKAILTGGRKGQAGGFWDEENILFLGLRSH